MSEDAEVNAAVAHPAAEIDVIELEERRANRNLKHWMVKAFSLLVIFMFVVCVLSLVYAAIIQEKDLNTTFIGEMFKLVFDFLRFVMS